MCAAAAPRTGDIQVRVIGDDEYLVDNLIAALSNGGWRNVAAIRSLNLVGAAVRTDTGDPQRMGEVVRSRGFMAFRHQADAATVDWREVYAITTRFSTSVQLEPHRTSYWLINALDQGQNVVLFVQLPHQAEIAQVNVSLGWRFWVTVKGKRAPNRVVYHDRPLDANANVWPDIAAA
jgi:hypothetical protein